MTSTPDPDHRKTARPLPWFPTGHDRARATTPATALPTPQSVLINPVVPLQSGSVHTLELSLSPNRPSRIPPHNRSDPLKSP
jgi:hypothetical protein